MLNPGSEFTEDELQSYVREPVAAYKYSRVVGITDGLPMGATGKILEREIQIPPEPTPGCAPGRPNSFLGWP